MSEGFIIRDICPMAKLFFFLSILISAISPGAPKGTKTTMPLSVRPRALPSAAMSVSSNDSSVGSSLRLRDICLFCRFVILVFS